MGDTRILVVDRTDEHVEAIARALRSQGCEIVTAPPRCRDVTEAVRACDPDVVLIGAPELESEFAEARRPADERPIVERAKTALMDERRLGETEAYRLLRRMAMSRNMRLIDVARGVLGERA